MDVASTVSASTFQAIIAAGIQQYCSDLATEYGYHEPERDTSLLDRLYSDSESIARYIVSDGFTNAGII